MIDRVTTVVIWNPSAGTADRASEARQMLETMPHVTVLEPGSRSTTIEETVRMAEDGAELIVAAGGDGTVNSVVEGLLRANTDSILGILPLGSGNDFARSLEIPLEHRQALQQLSSGRVSKVDVVEASSSQETRFYVNMLTGGNTGLYLQHMTDELKQRWGAFCYLRGVIDVLADLQTFRIGVTWDDGATETLDVLNVFVANGRFSGGGLAVSPEAEQDDGHVDVVIVRDGNPGDIASLTAQYVVGTYFEHELIEFRRAREVTIDSDPPLPLTVDGDEIGTTPVSVSVCREQLRVLLPEQISESQDG